MPLNYQDVGTSKGGTRWDAMCGKVRVAHISKEVLSITVGSVITWSWTVYLSTRPDGFRIYGVTASLEEAKAQVDGAWQTWLDASGLQDWERQYKEICHGVRMIRQALEETRGAGILPITTAVETPLQECELIAKTIHSLMTKP